MTITAKVLADSISPQGVRMTTFEIEYPRFILAELNTHRMLSKNSASSRAIPIEKMHEHIQHDPAMPVYWGKNQPGMTAKTEIENADRSWAEYLWRKAAEMMVGVSKQLAATGLHKQTANRVTEPWMTMKTVISGTEWSNLYYLRDHPDAQPEFQELAHAMLLAHKASTPVELEPGEWHLPYVTLYRSDLDNILHYLDADGNTLSVEDARILSASCCAQVSYRKTDMTLEKAHRIYKQLIESKPAHASPVEHQATPMGHRFATGEGTQARYWVPGITHQDRYGDYWSGNLRGWIQFRKLIPNEAVWGVVK